LDWDPVFAHSMGWVCAHDGERLVGFVNIAWDGSVHAFLLDTTVHPDYQRQGVGTALVREATVLAREQGAEWLHVDYDEALEPFYRGCGFFPTPAGLIHLQGE
jgi:GNAT superfamily N-acetyltransferase